jgi:hypothetical protein
MSEPQRRLDCSGSLGSDRFVLCVLVLAFTTGPILLYPSFGMTPLRSALLSHPQSTFATIGTGLWRNGSVFKLLLQCSYTLLQRCNALSVCKGFIGILFKEANSFRGPTNLNRCHHG